VTQIIKIYTLLQIYHPQVPSQMKVQLTSQIRFTGRKSSSSQPSPGPSDESCGQPREPRLADLLDKECMMLCGQV
jgi:hypothetical protein